MRTNQLVGAFAIAAAMVTAPVLRGVPAGSIRVNDPRPLAELLVQFQQAFGLPATYEDPRFVNTSDVILVKPPSQGHVRQLIPRGGLFEPAFDAPAPDASVGQIAQVLRTVIEQYHRTGYPGRYDVVQGKYMAHIVPTAVLGMNGVVEPTASVLDTRVSIPAEKGRTLFAGVIAVLGGVTKATGQTMNIGTAPNNLMVQSLMEQAALDQPAWQILEQAFQSTGRDLSWRLLYDAGQQFYAFNVRIVNQQRRR